MKFLVRLSALSVAGAIAAHAEPNLSTSQWVQITSPAIFKTPQVHYGAIKITGTVVGFLACYTELGEYAGDSSVNYFVDLTVGPSGYLAGGPGDEFIISGNCINNSMQNTLWSTAASELHFQAGTSSSHNFALAGVDLGRSYSGYTNNFAWGVFRLRSAQALVLSDGNGMGGGALYATRVVLDDGTAQVAGITGNGFSIYYDPADSGNDYLLSGAPGGVYNLAGGGVLAPVQLNVISAVSRKNHGAAGPFDINLPFTGPTGVECRNGGATNDFTLIVTFDTNVAVNGSPQAQVTTGNGQIGSGGLSNGGVVSASGAVVTVPLTNVADAQRIVITLFGVSDGTNTSNVTIPMGVLLGDTSGNGTVNATDVSQTKLKSGQTADASNFREDVSVNGVINSSDVSTIKLKSGTALP